MRTCSGVLVIAIAYVFFAGPCASAQETELARVAQEDKQVLDGDDASVIVRLLESRWELYAKGPRSGADAHRQNILALLNGAYTHKERDVRIVALKMLGALGAKEYFPAALEEYRRATFSDDKRYAAQIEPTISLFLRMSDAQSVEEISRAIHYQNRLVLLTVHEGKADQLPSEMLARLVSENMHSAVRDNYEAAQAALFVLAERNAEQANALVEAAETSNMRVSVKGQSDFYPFRYSSAIARRILAVTSAPDKGVALATTLTELHPGRIGAAVDVDQVVFLWCLEYAKKHRMTDAISALKQKGEDPNLEQYYKDRIAEAINAIMNPAGS